MYTDLIILLLSSLAITSLGLIIYLRNPVDAVGRKFGLLSISLVLWATANFLSDYSSRFDLFFTRLTFFAGVLSARALVVFILDFPKRLEKHKMLVIKLHRPFTYVLLVLIFTPLFIVSVSSAAISASSSIRTSYAYWLFIAYILYSVPLYVVIARKQLTTSLSKTQKKQAVLVYVSVAAYVILTVGSNVLLPLLSNNWTSSRLGPLFTLIFVAAVAYSIVRYQLFNIKFVIIRSVGYIASLAVLAVLSFIILDKFSRLLDVLRFTASEKIDSSVVMILVLAVLYGPFRKWFGKATNRLFFRDSYDIQELLDEFNEVVVSTIVLDDLLRLSKDTIEKYVRPQSLTFIIRRTGSTEEAEFYPASERVNYENDLELFESLLASNKSKLLIVDFLDESTSSKLKNDLRLRDIGVVAQFDSGTSSASMGFLIMGHKKSGDAYNSQDIKGLEIILKELSVVIQNALRFKEIQSFNLTLQQKIDDATKKLRHANERLKVIDEIKDDFISMASHQLRTPLTSIKGYLSMVLEGDAGKLNRKEREMLSQAFFSSQRMVYLIADLLNVSRLKTGKFVVDRGPVNLATLVSQELKQLKETAALRQLTLNYDQPKDFPELMLDETKTRQVVMNFVDNAIYYTPAGGYIDIRLIDKPATIELRVEDNGIGVPKSEQPHLFTKFYRAPNARKARPDGTGLGLFMAKKVVIAEGGSIIFESEVGKGSTFGFVFSKSKTGVH